MTLTSQPPSVEEIVDFLRHEYLRQLPATNEFELLVHGFQSEMAEETIVQMGVSTDLLGFGRDSGHDQPKAVLVSSTVEDETHVIWCASNNRGGAKTLLSRLLDRAEQGDSKRVVVKVHETNERACRILEQALFQMIGTYELSASSGKMLCYQFDLPIERVTLVG